MCVTTERTGVLRKLTETPRKLEVPEKRLK